MFAGILSRLGVWTGNTIPPTNENPLGFFEHRIIRENVTKRVLRDLGSDPLGVRSFPGLEADYDCTWLRQAVLNAIKADGYRQGPWLYKDAKLTLLWQHWAEAFPCAQWVIVRRDKEQVIDSCLRTVFMRQHSKDRAFWEAFATEYYWRLFNLANSGEFVRYIDAGYLIKGDHGQLIEVLKDVGIEYDADVVNQFVSPSYWHSKPAGSSSA